MPFYNSSPCNITQLTEYEPYSLLLKKKKRFTVSGTVELFMKRLIVSLDPFCEFNIGDEWAVFCGLARFEKRLLDVGDVVLLTDFVGGDHQAEGFFSGYGKMVVTNVQVKASSCSVVEAKLEMEQVQ